MARADFRLEMQLANGHYWNNGLIILNNGGHIRTTAAGGDGTSAGIESLVRQNDRVNFPKHNSI